MLKMCSFRDTRYSPMSQTSPTLILAVYILSKSGLNLNFLSPKPALRQAATFRLRVLLHMAIFLQKISGKTLDLQVQLVLANKLT